MMLTLKTLKQILCISSTLLILSCSTEAENPVINEIQTTISILDDMGRAIFVCTDSRLDDDSFTGTICCIQGVAEASPGEAFEFKYRSNLIDPNVTWTVVSGSISIEVNQDNTRAMVTFGDDFNGGSIRVFGDDLESAKSCGEPINIALIE